MAFQCLPSDIVSVWLGVEEEFEFSSEGIPGCLAGDVDSFRGIVDGEINFPDPISDILWRSSCAGWDSFDLGLSFLPLFVFVA